MADLLEQTTIHQRQVEKAFREMLASEAGKRVVFWLIENCSIYEEAFAGDSSNATNYMLGRQSAGRRVVAMLNQIDPRLYPKLLTDMAAIREIDAAEQAASQENDDNEDA